MTKSIQELTMRTSGKFLATSALDFVGSEADSKGSGARAIATHLDRIVKQAKAANNSAIKLLFNGPPGVGKTALALYLQHLLGCNRWSVNKYNGTQLKIELLEEMAAGLHFRSLYGDWRIFHIDEADVIPKVAQIRFLSLLDDLPAGVAVVCTSNCRLKDFESRFQSRFQAFDVIPPSPSEIEALLCDYIDPANAHQIATFACGNVRQALLDALGVLQQTMPA
jgi:replication-associated recombination protein RarA